MLDKSQNPIYNNIAEHLFCAIGSAEQTVLCRALIFLSKGDFMSINEKITGSYFRVPAELLSGTENGIRLSVPATILLSFLVDRADLSSRNADKFTHTDGRTYVIMTISEICDRCRCGREKAVSLVKELVDGGFIEKIRLGQGRPNRLFITEKTREIFSAKSKEPVNGNSEVSETRIPEFREAEGNQTNNNHIEYNHNNVSLSSCGCDYDRTVESIEEQIEADCFGGDDGEIVREIVYLMADILTCDKKNMRICGANIDMSLIKKRFSLLNSEHIEHIIGQLKNCKIKVRNARSYLLTLLYTTPTCMAASVTADFGYYHLNSGQ